MAPDRSLRIGVVGAGRLGASLAVALASAGYNVSAVSSRRIESARALAAALGPGVTATTSAARVLKSCDAVFLTVPDGAIGDLAAIRAWQPGQWAVHCSGALSLEVLSPAARLGAAVGCLHPLRSFPSRQPEPERFRGIVCGVEAAGALSEFLETAAHDIGASTVRLEGVDRALYHSSAVLVSNHLVGLAAAAARLWAAAGLPAEDARAALSPLLLASAQNVAARDLALALTGPIARGDVTTVERHLGALAALPDLRELYRRLSVELLRLPLGHSERTAEALKRLLEPPSE